MGSSSIKSLFLFSFFQVMIGSRGNEVFVLGLGGFLLCWFFLGGEMGLSGILGSGSGSRWG